MKKNYRGQDRLEENFDSDFEVQDTVGFGVVEAAFANHDSVVDELDEDETDELDIEEGYLE